MQNKYKELVNPFFSINEKDSPYSLINSWRENQFVIIKTNEDMINKLNAIYSTWGIFFNGFKKNEYIRSDYTDEGYVSKNKEKAASSNVFDYKEYYQTHANGIYPHFLDCELTKQFLFQMIDLGIKIISLIEEALPLEIKKQMKMSLSDMVYESDRHGFRVIHYPPLQELIISPRASAHTDICFLTMLPPATAEGLEIQNANGDWTMPKPGSSDILVFAGDMLNMASHGYIPSAVHRVTTALTT